MSANAAVSLGRVWFQWRGFSPVPFFILFLILPAEFTPTALTSLCFTLGILIAETGRIWAVGYAGSATRTRQESVPELVAAGPFLHVRNPLYISNILLYTCAGGLFGFTTLSIAIFFWSCIQYHFIVRYEEEILTRQFGESYQKYLGQVPRWLPSLYSSFPESSHTFSLAKAFRSEKSTLLQIVLLGVLWLLKQSFI